VGQAKMPPGSMNSPAAAWLTGGVPSGAKIRPPGRTVKQKDRRVHLGGPIGMVAGTREASRAEGKPDRPGRPRKSPPSCRQPPHALPGWHTAGAASVLAYWDWVGA